MLHRLKTAIRYRTYFETADSSGLIAYDADDRTKLAQKLHSSIYVSQGYVTAHDLDHEGIIDAGADPYRHHSRYFIVVHASSSDDSIVGSSRLIETIPEHGLDSLQTWQHMSLSPAGRRLVKRYDPNQVVEVSALVKVPGSSTLAVFMLYRRMFHYSLEHNYKLWLMACDDQLYRRLHRVFGKAITPIGPRQYYKGGMVIPAVVELPQATAHLLKARLALPVARRLMRSLSIFFLTGLSDDQLSLAQRKRAQKLRSQVKR